MSSGVEKLKNNKSIEILNAAEKGGYGIVSVVCVSYFHCAERAACGLCSNNLLKSLITRPLKHGLSDWPRFAFKLRIRHEFIGHQPVH